MLPLGRRLRLAATEARLNAWPQVRVTVAGGGPDTLGIHALHARSPHPDALPLVLTHGWPGSVVEFLDVLGPLVDPPAHGGDAADAFHVVVPSLPGYGFSDKPQRPGWGVERIADAWAELMARLGHDRYGAAGSDWGTTVSTLLGQRHAAHVAGILVVPPLAARSADGSAGCSIFPAEVPRASRRWAGRRFTDIRHWHELDRGGHFAAFEQPGLFVDEVRTFFRLVR